MDVVPSPCTGVCRLDTAGETCLGCRRKLDEIAAWSGLSEAGKRAVLSRIASVSTGPAARGDPS